MIKNPLKHLFLHSNFKMSWFLTLNNGFRELITWYDHIVTVWLHSNIVGNNMQLQLSLNPKTQFKYIYVIISNQWGAVAQRELWDLSGDHIKTGSQTFTQHFTAISLPVCSALVVRTLAPGCAMSWYHTNHQANSWPSSVNWPPLMGRGTTFLSGQPSEPANCFDMHV